MWSMIPKYKPTYMTPKYKPTYMIPKYKPTYVWQSQPFNLRDEHKSLSRSKIQCFTGWLIALLSSPQRKRTV